jgi:Putative phage abortive infection protein
MVFYFLSIFTLCTVLFLLVSALKKIFAVKNRIVLKTNSSTIFITSLLLLLAISFLIFSFIAPEIFTNIYSINSEEMDISNDIGKDILAAKGQVGDRFGGLMNPFIAIAGVIVTGLAFWMQYQANIQLSNQFAQQQKNDSRNQFEAHIFKLSEVQSQIVQAWNKKDRNNAVLIHEHKLVANNFLNDFDSCRKDLAIFCRLYNIINANNLHFYMEQDYIVAVNNFCTNINLHLFSINEICYIITFYGCNPYNVLCIKEVFKNKYNTCFIEDLINFLSHKRACLNNESEILERNSWEKGVFFDYFITENRSDIGKNNFDYFYDGYESNFSHYFRHLYHSINYINNFDDYPYEVKWKKFSKLIRTQMSNSEQILFYLNSISVIGRAWELSKICEIKKNNATQINEWLITKFDLIKNIPKGYRDVFEVEKFYPNVEWEDIPMCDEINYNRYITRIILKNEYYCKFKSSIDENDV